MSIENLKFRTAELADGEQIGELQLLCASESMDKELSPRVLEAGVMRILSLSHQGNMVLGAYLVVESPQDGIIACCLLQKQFSDWNCGFYLTVESVYIAFKYR